MQIYGELLIKHQKKKVWRTPRTWLLLGKQIQVIQNSKFQGETEMQRILSVSPSPTLPGCQGIGLVDKKHHNPKTEGGDWPSNLLHIAVFFANFGFNLPLIYNHIMGKSLRFAKGNVILKNSSGTYTDN